MSLSNRLFIGFKRLSCPTSWWQHTIATVRQAHRWKLIQVAGRIVSGARQMILRLALKEEKLLLFRFIRKRCYELVTAT